MPTATAVRIFLQRSPSENVILGLVPRTHLSAHSGRRERMPSLKHPANTQLSKPPYDGSWATSVRLVQQQCQLVICGVVFGCGL